MKNLQNETQEMFSSALGLYQGSRKATSFELQILWCHPHICSLEGNSSLPQSVGAGLVQGWISRRMPLEGVVFNNEGKKAIIHSLIRSFSNRFLYTDCSVQGTEPDPRNWMERKPRRVSTPQGPTFQWGRHMVSVKLKIHAVLVLWWVP